MARHLSSSHLNPFAEFMDGKLGHWDGAIVSTCSLAPILAWIWIRIQTEMRRCSAGGPATPQSAFIFVVLCTMRRMRNVCSVTRCACQADDCITIAANAAAAAAAAKVAVAAARGSVFAVGKSAHENYKFRFSLASAPFIIFSLISLPLQCWEFAILTKVFRARKASK